jgi:hypothetical protein
VVEHNPHLLPRGRELEAKWGRVYLAGRWSCQML